MAKMTRNNLKSLVKECLFEILLEASDETSERLSEARTSRKAPANKKRPTSRRPALDKISIGRTTEKARQPKKKDLDVSELTSDPIMAAIFKDTAATTLVEQAAAERGKSSRPGDEASRVAAQNDPSDLFGESADKWAALAFDD